jgi:hypothetical protein
MPENTRSRCTRSTWRASTSPAIPDDLDFLEAQLARVPTRKELARIALGVIFGAAGPVIGWMESFC